MQSPSSSLNPPSVRPPAWNLPNLVLWGRYALVLLMLGLVFFARTLADIAPIYLAFAGVLGASAYLVWLAMRHMPAGRIRWAYGWFLASLLASLLRVVLRGAVFATGLDPTTPVIAGSSSMLYVLSNAAIIIAMAVFLPRSSSAIGSTLRVLLGSALMGVTALIIVLAFPFFGEQARRTIFGSVSLLMPGFTVAIIFAFIVIGLRYGRRGGPVIAFTILGVVCFLIVRVVTGLVLAGAADQQVVPFLFSPLYAIASAVVAHGIYRSIERPPQFTPPDVGQPNNDWLFWSMLPRASAVVALLVAVASGQVPLPLLLVLGVVWLGHELVSFVDARRVQQALTAAIAREQQTVQMVRFFQHELRGYTTELEGLIIVLELWLNDATTTRPATAYQQPLNLLKESTQKARDLLEQLLLLGETRALPAQPPQPVPLRAVAEEVRTFFLAAYQQDDTFIVVDMPTDLVLRGNPLFLRLALRTALRNAVGVLLRERLPTRQIRISATQQAGQITVRIADTGPGFPPVLLATLHTWLAQASTPALPNWSTTPGGFGLGLLLLRRIAEWHGGQLALGNNAPAPGAWVQLSLPAADQGAG